jgi:hypothetical protein
MAFEPGRMLAELEARGIDNARELMDRAEPPAIQGAIDWWDDRRRREGPKKIRPGLLASVIRGGGKPPVEPVPPEPKRSAFDEHLDWCARHVPDLSPSIAGGCFDVLRVQLGREPTAAEVRARVAERLADYGPEPA